MQPELQSWTMIFKHVLKVKKAKTIVMFDGFEPRRCEDIKGIVAPEIGPKSFGTFEKQAPGPRPQLRKWCTFHCIYCFPLNYSIDFYLSNKSSFIYWIALSKLLTTRRKIIGSINFNSKINTIIHQIIILHYYIFQELCMCCDWLI